MKYYVYATETDVAVSATDGRTLITTVEDGADAIADFCAWEAEAPEFWVYDATAAGAVEDLLPAGDVHLVTERQAELGSPTLPALPTHPTAEANARWTMEAGVFLDRYAGPSAEAEEEDEEEEKPAARKAKKRK